jgi:hypothetical protein
MVRKIGTFLIAVLFMFLLTACSEGEEQKIKNIILRKLAKR